MDDRVPRPLPIQLHQVAATHQAGWKIDRAGAVRRWSGVGPSESCSRRSSRSLVMAGRERRPILHAHQRSDVLPAKVGGTSHWSMLIAAGTAVEKRWRMTPQGRPVSMARFRAAEIIDVDGPGGLAGAAAFEVRPHHRRRQPHHDHHDRNHHQQFDQRKAAGTPTAAE